MHTSKALSCTHALRHGIIRHLRCVSLYATPSYGAGPEVLLRAAQAHHCCMPEQLRKES